MPYDFTGQRILITGGNMGLGAGVSRGFLAAGADLIIAGIEPDVAETAEAWAQEFGRSVTGITCDIADLAQVAQMAEATGPVDALINNAGLELITPIADPSPQVDATFRRVTEINVIGTFSVIRAMLPHLKDGGRIVNTASVWAKSAVAEFSAYCASKHAVIGLTRSLAHELGPRGISVNAVCPGWVRTTASMRSLSEMATRSGQTEDDLLNDITGTQVLPGLMEPEDMAEMYMFLASPAARNITGQSFTVDRGEIMH